MVDCLSDIFDLLKEMSETLRAIRDAAGAEK
jgi:hypothetical protein